MKRIICVLLIALMIISLCACSNSEQTSNDDQSYESDTESSYDESEEDADTENTEDDEKQELSEYKISNTFVNNRMWINYDNQKGLLDENGNVLLSIDGNYATYDFTDDGYSYYLNHNEEEEDELTKTTVIDKNGKECFVLEDTEEETYKLLAHGDKSFLIFKTEYSFSKTKFSIYAVDESKKEIGTKESVKNEIENCIYAGNSVYILEDADSNSYSFNINEGKMFF